MKIQISKPACERASYTDEHHPEDLSLHPHSGATFSRYYLFDPYGHRIIRTTSLFAEFIERT